MSLYTLLIIIRLAVALSPSYLHPDENFQGAEVLAGEGGMSLPHLQSQN
jgi:hypothetical protein